MLRTLMIIALTIICFESALCFECPKNAKDGKMSQAMELFKTLMREWKQTCEKSPNGAVSQAFVDSSKKCLNNHVAPYLSKRCTGKEVVLNLVNTCLYAYLESGANRLCSQDTQDRISRCMREMFDANKNDFMTIFQENIGTFVKQGTAFEMCYKSAMKLV